MIVKLAGYNVEAELLKNLEQVDPAALTPETFSAAYARISRSAKDVTTLRKNARKAVEKARKSNQQIIFGMGHHSVAEHAVFNFDIIGISRLALEELEKFRLNAYTEKSQRYVTLKGDFLVPDELAEDETARESFSKTIAMQNDFYSRSYGILQEDIFKRNPELAAEKSNQSLLEGWAKEDARYVLSLATEGQLGMTINARNLEHLFRRFNMSTRAEVREIGKQMYDQVIKVAPSIFLFSEPSQFTRDLQQTFGDFFKKDTAGKSPMTLADGPKLVRFTENADDIVLASFLAEYRGLFFQEALEHVGGMSSDDKEKIFKDLFKNMEFFDPPPREFEMVDMAFQAVISASNFAQLKRHRMATLLTGKYNHDLGNVVPESIKRNGLETEFMEIIGKTNEVYLQLREKYGDAADYILTNSHSRPVLMKMNLREAYHFIRLRSDAHAQWDIRNLSDGLLGQIKEAMPLSTMMLCGKSSYIEKFKSIYNRKPKFDT
ncbi:MAG: FAD-dependent thymidylate synthase [bacterium]|nr:FAD-dependent thymidylate synthase [bacterium]